MGNIAFFILEFLKVLVSFPFVLGLSIVLFRKELQNLLKNGKVSVPGICSLEAPQEPTKIKTSKNNTKEVKKALEQTKAELESSQASVAQQQTIIEQQNQTLESIIARLNIFEFYYLQSYFVLGTKLSLLWIYNKGGVSVEEYNQNYTTVSQDERDTIIKVLKEAFLIVEQDSRIVVSPRGVEFLKYIGLLKQQ